MWIVVGLKLMQNKTGAVTIEIDNLQFSESFWQEWKNGIGIFSGRISLTLKLEIAAVVELLRNVFRGHPYSLGVSTSTDLVIYFGAENGKKKKVKCHKAVLSGKYFYCIFLMPMKYRITIIAILVIYPSDASTVFAAMFQSDMVESNQSTLTIIDYSETTIMALIDFVYRQNVRAALESCDICLELLIVADKYDIKLLKDITLHIIWYMPFDWFSVDMLIKLVCYVRNLGDDLVQAECKGWMVLKW